MLVHNESFLPIIDKVAEYLGKPLPYAHRADLKAHIAGVEAYGLELAKARLEALKTLHNAENKMLYPKDKEMTELDRRIKLQAAVSEVRQDYEYLVALEELTARRIDIAKLFL